MKVSLFCFEQKISWESFLLRKIRCYFPDKPTQIKRLPNGKPVFDPPVGLCFSVSDTDELCTIALSTEALGVDMERTNRRASYLEIARRYFNSTEYHILKEASHGEQCRLFLRYWTAKEACLKLNGCGLARGLHQCKIDFDTETCAKALLFKETMYLRTVTAREQFLITIASYNPNIEVHFYES